MKSFLWLLGGVVLAVVSGFIYALIAYIRKALDWDR